MATTTPRPAIEALDVPLSQVARMPACELAHLLDQADVLFAALPAEHPENVPSSDWTPGGQR